MCRQYHTTELIGSLEYGVLKKTNIIPKTTMFTNIQKVGGGMPKIARKVDSWWLGYLVDRFIRYVLQSRKFDINHLDKSLTEIKEHTGVLQCTFEQLCKDEEYFSNIASWILASLPKNDYESYEPEWSYGTVMGHPDLVFGDTIYDIKTTGRFGRMRIHTIFQLLAYAALAQENGLNVTHIGVVLPAQKKIERVCIAKWNGKKFLELLEEKASEKEKIQNIDPQLLIEFALISDTIGSHVLRKGTIRKALDILDHQKPIQIFLGGRMNLDHQISDTDISQSLSYINKNNIRVFVHTPYSINLSRLNFKPRHSGDKPRSVSDVLINQLETTACFGGCGAVVHLGHQADMKYDEAYENMIENIELSAAFATPNCPLLLETDSGGSLLDNPNDLADFYLDLDENIRANVGICVDTCHIFAAGYDNLETLIMFRDKGVPVKLIHFNDSQYPKGSKKDRHAQFGRGLIGHQELISVAKFATALDIPMVTE